MKSFAFLLVLISVSFATAGDSKKFNIGLTGAEILLLQSLKSPSPDIVVNSLLLTFPPGDPGAEPHFHSGPVIGYIIEGELLFQMKDQPIKVLSAGDMFYESDRDIHVWGANASNSTNCKVLATVYGRPGEEVLTFAPDHKRPETYEQALALAKRQ